MYEYGNRIAQWVSAIEVLCHPEDSQVNFKRVIQVLESFAGRWHAADLRKTSPIKLKQCSGQVVTFISRVYEELYSARNDFTHGNTVVIDKVFAFGDRKGPTLPMLAPLVYEVALLVKAEEIINGALQPAGQTADLSTKKP